MINDHVVVDASLAVKWLVNEERFEEARAIAREWQEQGIQITAPCFMLIEVTNALHKRIVANEMSEPEAVSLVGVLLSSGIELRDPPEIYVRALELASMLRQRAAYDSHYLALAEFLGCEFWTADRRFYRAASAAAGNVRWIGDFTPIS